MTYISKGIIMDNGIIKNIEYVKSQPDIWYEAHPMMRDLVDTLERLLKVLQ